jgi:hypothetical protein
MKGAGRKRGWSEYDVRRLRTYAPMMTCREAAVRLGRSFGAVSWRATLLCIRFTSRKKPEPRPTRGPRTCYLDHIFSALRRHPEGLTVEQMAQVIGTPHTSLLYPVLVLLRRDGVVLRQRTRAGIYRLPPIAYHPRTP